MNITITDLTMEEFIKIAKAFDATSVQMVERIEEYKPAVVVEEPKVEAKEPRTKYTPEQKKEWAKLLETKSLAEVSRMTGIPKSTLYDCKKTVVSNDDGLLNRSQLAKKLNVKPQAITYWNSKGCPCVTVEGKKKYNIDEVKVWKENNISDREVKAKTPSDFAIWQRQMFDLIDSKKLDRGKTCGQVFNKMTAKYGVVWDQLRKDYYKETGKSSHSTMHLCHWLQTTNPVYANMFDSILEGMVA